MKISNIQSRISGVSSVVVLTGAGISVGDNLNRPKKDNLGTGENGYG